MSTVAYERAPHQGPDCSTPRSARLRTRRFAMAYEPRSEPPEYTRLADEAREVLLARELDDPAGARAAALRHIIEQCPIPIQPDTLFLGGEDPFFFNLLLPALQHDRYSREGRTPPDEETARMQAASLFYAPCFEGHITPGLELLPALGLAGLRQRICEHRDHRRASGPLARDEEQFFAAALASCESVAIYARRYRDEAERLAATVEPDRAAELRAAVALLERVPEQPAETFLEALQSYWLAYVLVTLEMGGCCPGGGLGLGRLDQFLHPYYARDLAAGRLTREQALEAIELFLLAFRHIDYYTPHQFATPGSQASLGGVTPTGADAANETTALILEASLRLQMPAPYLSLRLYRNAPAAWWQQAASYVLGGLGFSIVNDEVLIPALLRHGRSLADARDYICSCCYEHTIPGREAFHPNGCYLNLPLVLELALNEGRSLLTGERIGCATPPPAQLTTFEAVMAAFLAQLHHVLGKLTTYVNAADACHSAWRRYPLMSLFIDDCLAKARDVCAGGARYNLTGCIVAGLPNTVNSLAAIRELVFGAAALDLGQLVEALRTDFADREPLRQRLLAAPKWGNGDRRVDELAGAIARALYGELSRRTNARGGRWQLALYSFVANVSLGKAVGAGADGRRAGDILTRNLNPTPGSDRHGPTAVLESLAQIDFTQSPDGAALDLRFDPKHFTTAAGRAQFVAFLKAFVELGIMQMQISVVDTATLVAAREHPEHYGDVMVKVAGYSARFVDLPRIEQDEIIGRTMQAV